MQANIDQWSAMLPNGKQNGSTVIHRFFGTLSKPAMLLRYRKFLNEILKSYYTLLKSIFGKKSINCSNELSRARLSFV
jgi:hypothetical protein